MNYPGPRPQPRQSSGRVSPASKYRPGWHLMCPLQCPVVFSGVRPRHIPEMAFSGVHFKPGLSYHELFYNFKLNWYSIDVQQWALDILYPLNLFCLAFIIVSRFHSNQKYWWKHIVESKLDLPSNLIYSTLISVKMKVLTF